MNEIERVKQVYRRRLSNGLENRYPKFSPFQHYSRFEREYWIGLFLTRHFGTLDDVRLLEIGAAGGCNIPTFFQLGVKRDNFFANELLADRADHLKHWLPESNIHVGDARELPWRDFDVIYQSMVFTSVLDDGVRLELAKTMWLALKPGGLILWHDMHFNNPRNPDIRGIKLSEIRQLFPNALIEAKRITLAPPVGRRVGRLYPILNWPFLRTHTIAILKKPLTSE